MTNSQFVVTYSASSNRDLSIAVDWCIIFVSIQMARACTDHFTVPYRYANMNVPQSKTVRLNEATQ